MADDQRGAPARDDARIKAFIRALEGHHPLSDGKFAEFLAWLDGTGPSPGASERTLPELFQLLRSDPAPGAPLSGQSFFKEPVGSNAAIMRSLAALDFGGTEEPRGPEEPEPAPVPAGPGPEGFPPEGGEVAAPSPGKTADADADGKRTTEEDTDLVADFIEALLSEDEDRLLHDGRHPHMAEPGVMKLEEIAAAASRIAGEARALSAMATEAATALRHASRTGKD